MKLIDILHPIQTLKVYGNSDIEIKAIDNDSRNIGNNDVFVAIPGLLADGHDYIDKAILKGATVVVCEKLPKELSESVCYVLVENAQLVLGLLLSNYYGNPSSKLKIVGVTGTNGKTTTVTLLYRLFKKLGYKVGLLSTVVNFVDDQVFPATHTTPDAVQLFSLLNKMVVAGCEYCFMEVSSHALHQNRVSGLQFTGAVFSNITHDHLDYHNTFDEYIRVKKLLFDSLSANSFALVNNDDKNGEVMLQNTAAAQHTYSLKSFSDYKCRIVESHFEGMQLLIDSYEIWTRLIGNFNAYNVLSVYATAMLLDQNAEEVLGVLSAMDAVDGRFQVYRSNSGIIAIVDYAHTPDALENVLNTIREIKEDPQALITVVGTGGDRDKTKRPIMGRMAAMKSTKVIFTSDNPRSEDPAVIADEMKAGVEIKDIRKVLTIIDRKEAIRTALHIANSGDIVLVAGKGHEDYQVVKGVKSHFDDREVIIEIFNEL